MKTNKEIIEVAVKNYGHLIKRKSKIDNYQFANLISESYSLCNPINMSVWKTVRDNVDLRFERGLDGFISVSTIH